MLTPIENSTQFIEVNFRGHDLDLLKGIINAEEVYLMFNYPNHRYKLELTRCEINVIKNLLFLYEAATLYKSAREHLCAQENFNSESQRTKSLLNCN